tara:strand:- start:7194 stop:8255 length:1062 start_codon:yes stop_codon:yes gene_type:complete
MKFLEKLKYKESQIHWYLKSVYDLGVLFACIIYITSFGVVLPNEYFTTLTLQDYAIYYIQIILLFILITYFGFKFLYNLALNYKDFFKSLAVNVLFIFGLFQLHDLIGSYMLLINIIAFTLYIVLLIKKRYVSLFLMHFILLLPLTHFAIIPYIMGSDPKIGECSYSNIHSIDKMKEFRFDNKYSNGYEIKIVEYARLVVPKIKECYIKHGYSEDKTVFSKGGSDLDGVNGIIKDFENAETKRYRLKDYYKDRKAQLNGFANALSEIEATKFYNNYNEKWKVYNYAVYDFLLTYIERVEDAYSYRHITQTYRKERLQFAKDYLNTVFAKDSKFREDKFVNENIEKLEEFLDNI